MLFVIICSAEKWSNYVAQKDTHEEKSLTDSDINKEDNQSEDDYSILDFDGSLIFNFLYDEDEDVSSVRPASSVTSIESQYSAVVLNENYEDHLYNFDRRDSDPSFSQSGSERKPSRSISKTYTSFA